MKRTLLFVFLVLAVLSLCAVQAPKVEKKIRTIRIDGDASAEEIAKAATDMALAQADIADDIEKGQNELRISLGMSGKGSDKSAFMGVFSDDLTLEKAGELKYHEYYGVLITGLSPNGPAQKYKLMADDILMQIGDTKITDKSHMMKVLQSYAPGDSTQLTVFRAGETLTLNFVFGSRQDDEENVTVTRNKIIKRTRSVGGGGGTWMPIFFAIDTKDASNFITRDPNFDALNKDGILLMGGGGKGNVGKGFFIGGMGAGYQLDKLS
jgi:hypothetical protein